MQYSANHAELYDLVFLSRGKDFEAEADSLTRTIRSQLPAARSLLDVACGTGAHLAAFSKSFDHVEGVEYAPAMLEVARDRLPGVGLHAGDMRDFDLGRTFDAVTCMGNSVACVSNADELTASVGRMAAHLESGGVLVVEPWWFPDNFIDGHVGGHLLKEEGRVITRVTRSVKHGMRTHHEVKFVVAEPTGIREFAETLVVGLFTREQYEAAFEAAGCSVRFISGLQLADGRPNSPGLFVGVRR